MKGHGEFASGIVSVRYQNNSCAGLEDKRPWHFY